MKNILLTLIAASVVLISCNSGKNSSTDTDSTRRAANVTGATMTFEKNNFDFGKIKDGEKVTHEFKFVNNGTEPLIINDAKATCGCTVPQYPKEPVAPGKSGVIKVVFDSSGKVGMQNKVVTVTSNANPGLTELYLVGEVQGAVPVDTTRSGK